MENIRKYVAEFIGTFVLVLVACGVAGQTCAPAGEGSGYLITALAFGLVIVAMAYSIGNAKTGGRFFCLPVRPESLGTVLCRKPRLTHEY